MIFRYSDSDLGKWALYQQGIARDARAKAWGQQLARHLSKIWTSRNGVFSPPATRNNGSKNLFLLHQPQWFKNNIYFLPHQDLRHESQEREAERRQLEKALQDAEIQAKKEHRAWHREHQRCQHLQEMVGGVKKQKDGPKLGSLFFFQKPQRIRGGAPLSSTWAETELSRSHRSDQQVGELWKHHGHTWGHH